MRYCATVHTVERGMLTCDLPTWQDRRRWLERVRNYYTVTYTALRAF